MERPAPEHLGAAASPPRLSIVIPTSHAWPSIEQALAAAVDQCCVEPYEVLVLDGHGAALAGEPELPVRWVRALGKDLFELRALGIAAARGDVVMLSEDHCIAPRDWCARTLAAHEKNPAAVLIGAVANHADSTRRAHDRASFLLTLGPFAPPISGGERLPVPTNLSVKLAALPPGPLPPGWLEYEFLAALGRQGELGVAPDVVLAHRQCLGPLSALRIHFHSGRCYGASTRAWPRSRRDRWFRTIWRLPRHLFRMTRPALERGAGGAPPGAADRLWLIGLILANVLGQLAGALAGPGASRRRIVD